MKHNFNISELNNPFDSKNKDFKVYRLTNYNENLTGFLFETDNEMFDIFIKDAPYYKHHLSNQELLLYTIIENELKKLNNGL